MKLTILGCYGPYPAAGKACSGYLLQEGGVNILLDCGNGVLSRLQQTISLWDLHAVLISHLHADHIADLSIMRYALDPAVKDGRLPDPLLLYAPEEPATEFERLSYKQAYRVKGLRADSELTIGPFSITFTAGLHAVPSFAMRIKSKGKSLVYSGDTEYLDSLADFASGTDLFLCEANYLSDDISAGHINHLSAKLAAELAMKGEVKKLVLTHHHPERNQAASLIEAKQFFPRVKLAVEGSVKII